MSWKLGAGISSLLTKPRLNLLVLVTTLAGLYLASPEGVAIPPARAAHARRHCAGGGGAAALNQVWERRTDALMRRTSGRPLPGGRLGAGEAPGSASSPASGSRSSAFASTSPLRRSPHRPSSATCWSTRR